MPTADIHIIKTTAEQIISHPTWDMVTVFALIAAGFFYGISAGKWRIGATILYTYTTLAIFSSLPLDTWIKSYNLGQEFAIKIGIFLLLFLFFAIMLGSRNRRGIAFSRAWWQVFLLSFLQVGLLIHIFVSFLPKDKIMLLAPITRTVFANPSLHLWWLGVPLAVLILLRRLGTQDD